MVSIAIIQGNLISNNFLISCNQALESILVLKFNKTGYFYKSITLQELLITHCNQQSCTYIFTKISSGGTCKLAS